MCFLYWLCHVVWANYKYYVGVSVIHWCNWLKSFLTSSVPYLQAYLCVMSESCFSKETSGDSRLTIMIKLIIYISKYKACFPNSCISKKNDFKFLTIWRHYDVGHENWNHNSKIHFHSFILSYFNRRILWLSSPAFQLSSTLLIMILNKVLRASSIVISFPF